ncbi:MAG TPA: leucyl aminopeptidase family protein [Thermomonas sp.]|jgi:leucyl aminopeptidase|nr:leucyl aminopeptidase family protein [Thermomonas sp.]
MSLPACFATAHAAEPALALVTVDKAGFAAWVATQPAPVQAWLAAQDFTGASGTQVLVPGADGHPLFAVAGVADVDDPFALAHLPRLLPPRLYRLDAASPRPVPIATAALGWGLGCYRFERYLKACKPFGRLQLDDANHPALAQTLALLAATHRVRDLVNTPTEHMGPDELEAVAADLARTHGGTLRTVTGERLLAENFPAIHAVGRASHRAPRLIELTWGDPAHPRVALVGKGVCFDTGGLNIKTGDGMRQMKKDMGGAAHAIALAQLVMARRLPVRLQLLVAAVENAIGPNSYRPGEVIVTRSGVSVEIDNTDAEGRVILGDALAYAGEGQPDLLMDFSTLTGAARVALGPDLPALFCNDEALAADYLAAGVRTRDPLWRMPLWRPYAHYLKSSIADMANGSASRMAGAISAALYLERFVPDGQRWSHVDGYAWNDFDRPGKPAGGEAQGLRAAFALLQARYPGAVAATN